MGNVTYVKNLDVIFISRDGKRFKIQDLTTKAEYSNLKFIAVELSSITSDETVIKGIIKLNNIESISVAESSSKFLFRIRTLGGDDTDNYCISSKQDIETFNRFYNKVWSYVE